MPRLLHFVGDEAHEPTATGRKAVEDRRHQRSQVKEPPSREPTTTMADAADIPWWPATAPGPDGQQIRIQRSQLVNRFRGLEAWAAEVEGVSVRVWRIRHWEHPLYGMAVAGRQYSHVLINKPRTQCAILRLAVLAHECEHIRRGDLDSGNPFARDSFAEAACEGAAERRIQQTAQLIGSSADTGAPILDAEICRQCYRNGGKACGQQPGVYDQVQDRLAWAAP